MRTAFVSALLILVLAPGRQAAAQEAQAETQEKTVEKQPEPFEISEVASRAAQFDEQLRNVERTTQVERSVESARQALQSITQSRQQLSAEVRGLDLRTLAPTSQDRIRGRWQGLRREIDDIEGGLASDVDAISAARARIRTDTKRWQKTAEALKATQAPDVALNRVAGVLRQSREADRKLSRAMARLLEVQDRTVREHLALNAGLDAIRNAESATRSGTLSRRAHWLWADWRATDFGQESKRVRLTVAKRWRDLGEWSSEGASMLWALIIFGLCVGVSWRTRSRQPQPAGEGGSPRGSAAPGDQALGPRPVSAAMLLAFMLVRLTVGSGPVAFDTLTALVAFFALSRVLGVLARKPWQAGLQTLVITFVVQIMGRPIEPASVLGRLHTIVVAAMSLCAATLILRAHVRHKSREATGDGFAEWVLAALASVVAIGAATGMIGAFAGFVLLGEYLVDSLLIAVMLALLLFTTARVLGIAWTHALETDRAQKLRIVRLKPRALRMWGKRIIAIYAAYLWLSRSMERLELLTPTVNAAEAWLARERSLGGLSFTWATILTFTVAVLGSWLAARLTRFVLEEELLPRTKLPRGVPGAISTLTGHTLVLIGLILAVQAAGIDTSKLAIIAGALSVGIGFGLQNVVGNFVSGLILLFERPIQTGDTVEFNGMIGTVVRIGIRASLIRTFIGSDVLVPNQDLVSNVVTNWTLSDSYRRIDIPVGVSYGANPRQVLDLVLATAKGRDDIVDDPEPVVFFLNYGNSSLDFELRAWTDRISDWVRISSDLRVDIFEALKKAGIEIPFPQRDLHIKSTVAKAQLPAESSGVFEAGPGEDIANA